MFFPASVSRRKPNSRSSRRRRGDRRRTTHQTGRFEQLESRMLLSSGPSWIIPGGVAGAPAFTTGVLVDTDAAGAAYVAATTRNADTDWDIWLSNYSADGSKDWTNHLEFAERQTVHDVKVAPDGQSVYLAGNFAGSVNLDPQGDPSGILQSQGETDAYVAKYSTATGSLLWAKQWGGTLYDGFVAIALHGTGADTSVYATGQTEIPINKKKSERDYKIVKFDNDGGVLWDTQVPGNPEDVALYAPDGGFVSLYVSGLNGGSIFVTKMVENGSTASPQWTEEYTGVAVTSGIDVDDSGGIYVIGHQEELDFGSQTIGVGGYLVKLSDSNSQGDVQWVKHIAGGGLNLGVDVSVDGNTVYAVGGMFGPTDFDPSVGYELTGRGPRDAFLARYDLDGNIIAAQRMGGSDGDLWTGVAANNGQVYVTGRIYSSDADFPASGLNSPDTAFVDKTIEEDGEVFTMRLDASAPIVTITAPDNNASFEEGTAITFTGTTSAGVVTWSSSIDGSLGDGSAVILSPGVHHITASATGGVLTGLAGTVVVVYQPGVGVYDYASSETTIDGTVASGSLADTNGSDDSYEAIREVQTGGKPSNRKSLLDHRWTFNVTGGATVTFSVEAYHTANSEGDDFLFEYSTDDANYTDMMTVTETADDDIPHTFALPATVSGTVYIRVTDTNRTGGNTGLDTVFIDDMFIRSEGAAAAGGLSQAMASAESGGSGVRLAVPVSATNANPTRAIGERAAPVAGSGSPSDIAHSVWPSELESETIDAALTELDHDADVLDAADDSASVIDDREIEDDLLDDLVLALHAT